MLAWVTWCCLWWLRMDCATHVSSWCYHHNLQLSTYWLEPGLINQAAFCKRDLHPPPPKDPTVVNLHQLPIVPGKGTSSPYNISTAFCGVT
uniref:Uncharacterized protein n=1 Tax=Arundo donax TaxID=35708 RepID=A0A0A9VGH9_ARUDO